MAKRVAIGMISHATNVFSPVPTPLQAWKSLIEVDAPGTANPNPPGNR